MRILLIAGHGDGDPGAVGSGYREADLTREVVRRLKPLLPCGADIADTSRNWFAWLGTHSYDFSPYDYVLEIHFNSGGGHGTEIFVTSSAKSTAVETAVINSLSAAGLRNRGVKRKNFRVISRAAAQGVSAALLEVCFIDSASDMTVWGQKSGALIRAAADGIIKGFGLKEDAMTGEERAKLNGLAGAVADLSAKVDGLTKPKMIYNYIDENIPPWARDAVRWARARGIIEGDDNGLLQLDDIKLWMLVVLYRTLGERNGKGNE